MPVDDGSEYLLPTIQSTDQLQRQINRFIQAALDNGPKYGTTLPAATGLDGRIFVLTTGPTLYQLQSGSWVVI